MNTTRSGFSTASGAATRGSLAHAQDHGRDHGHQTVPSDLTLQVKALESLRGSARGAGHAWCHDWRRQGYTAAAGRQRMNGVHDIGDMHGMGPIQNEKDEPVFHGRWEARAFALTLAMAGWRKWTLAGTRHQLELFPATEYLRMSDYLEPA